MTESIALDEAEALRRILEIARALLRVEDIGAKDHFLPLGGDSLLAPILARQIETAAGVRPSPVEIFTLSFGELAKTVASRGSAA